MPKAEDPFYNRKPVPDEFIQDVGPTGLTAQEEYASRERKYSLPDGTDARKFTGKYTGNLWSGNDKDPHYSRKPVDLKQIDGVGETGLTPEQEYANRERKFSLADGTDARKFTGKFTGNLWSGDPKDPYYGRKSISKQGIVGVGDSGNTIAQDYEVRERKQSLFQLNSDPFQQFTGKGHRESVSGVAGVAIQAQERRRSSAIAQGGQHTGATAGYRGDKLAPIESKPELPPVNAGGSLGASDSTAADPDQINGAGPTHTTTTATTTTTGTHTTGGHAPYHDTTTVDDPDSVAPHEVR